MGKCGEMCIHLYDLLDVLVPVDELHLRHPHDVLELPDRPDHTEQTQKQQKQQRGLGQQRGAPTKRAPPFAVSVNAVASVVSVSVLCDQDDQVVPAHHVDDIDEVHELDPVHQVDHKDEQGRVAPGNGSPETGHRKPVPGNLSLETRPWNLVPCAHLLLRGGNPLVLQPSYCC